MTEKEYFGKWIHVFDMNEFNRVLLTLNELYKTKSINPSKPDVFKAFNLCKYEDLKVVFIGQDPYPQKGIATGILFGNKRETKENDLSPSLKVIKEASIDFETPHNCVIFDPTLEGWAKQGVLMLNSSLTVETGRVGSHTMLWRPFISKLLKSLSNNLTAIVYVLFGKQAQTFKPYIKEKFNYIFEIGHPAYYARIGKRMPSKLFIDINNVIEGIWGNPIEWYKEA